MEISFVTSADGSQIRIGQMGDGEKNILIIPGLAEHLGRYGYMADSLSQAGFRVTVMEPRGHGKSDGIRGHVDHWGQFAEDVQAVAGGIDGDFYLLGHSTGGLIALYSVLEGLENRIRALALSGPNVVDTVDAPIKKAAARVLSKLTPKLSMATGLNTQLLSRDPQIVKAYEQDPMVYGTITARFFIEMLKAQERIIAAATACALPLILQVGEKDGIVDPMASMAMARNWKTPAEIICYPGLYHEIFNEPEKDTVLADLVRWLDAQS